MNNLTKRDPIPFWVDEPLSSHFTGYRGSKKILLKIWIYSILVIAVIMIAFLFSLLSKIFALIYILLVCLTLIRNYYFSVKRKAHTENVESIQQHAKEVLQASTIGSAIHVAGHPRLERDQPVILGITTDSLVICNYDSPEPIDRIQLTDIQAAYTVVYDDERIPHIDIIDSTAQALQLLINRDGKSWTCLFRRMLNVRPIDWYHAIQQSKQ